MDRRVRNVLVCGTALVVAGLPSACSADGAAQGSVATASVSDQATVTIARSRFEPREVVVGAGQAVRFANTDPFAHTVTASDDAPVWFDSGVLRQGDGFQIAFDEPGTYTYSCEIHPTMRAVVTVR